jgi:hypothetical protein
MMRFVPQRILRGLQSGHTHSHAGAWEREQRENEWWHFEAFPKQEVRKKYKIIE